MGWRGDRGCPQRLLATRRLTTGSRRAPGFALPWRRGGCRRPVAGRPPARLEPPTPQRLPGLLEGFCPEPHPEEQVAVNSNGRLLLLRLADIDWLEIVEDGVALHAGKETHLLHDSLAAISAKLPPGRFLRVSSSALVNVAQIRSLRRLCQSEWRVLLRNGTRLTLTRGYGEHLRQGGWFTIAAIKPLVRSRLTVRRLARD